MFPENQDPQREFSIVVPCYNEEGAIRETIDELTREICQGRPCELIVVDDGSSDRTGELLDETARSGRYPHLVVLRHNANRGYGAALKTGIHRARTGLIVITDADGSYPNERIPELVELAAKHDMVVGSRTADDVTYSKIRKIPKFFLRRWVSWLAGVDVPDMNSGMRVFSKRIAEKFLSILPDTFSFTTTITLAMLTNSYSVLFVPIGYKARVGKSKIKPIRDTLRFTQLILRTGMYFAPIRVLMPVVGLFTALFAASFAYDLFVLQDLTEKTLLLLVLATNTGMFTLLADMIDKRSSQ